MNDELIIEIKYGGLGDHLFFSPIPRLSKKQFPNTKVYISEHSEYRNLDYKKYIVIKLVFYKILYR